MQRQEYGMVFGRKIDLFYTPRIQLPHFVMMKEEFLIDPISTFS